MQFCQSLFIILYVFSTIIEIKKNAGELLEPARKHKQKKKAVLPTTTLPCRLLFQAKSIPFITLRIFPAIFSCSFCFYFLCNSPSHIHAACRCMGQGMGDAAAVSDDIQALIAGFQIIIYFNFHIVEFDLYAVQ